jgi:outer membrane protein assembly factor BamB
VWKNELRTEVVTIGPGFAISYDADGKELWRLPMQSAITIASPFAWNGTLYLTSGAGGEPTRPVAAIRPGASGEIAVPAASQAPAGERQAAQPATGEQPTQGGAQPGEGEPAPVAGDAKLVQGKPGEPVIWYDPAAGGPYLPTPLIYDGRLYVLNEKGVLAVRDAATGREIYKSRIHREARNFTASPWAYRDSVFMINEEGATFVIGAGADQVELRGINRLDDFVEATPALSGDRLLIRTKGKLYSLRQGE